MAEYNAKDSVEKKAAKRKKKASRVSFHQVEQARFVSNPAAGSTASSGMHADELLQVPRRPGYCKLFLLFAVSVFCTTCIITRHKRASACGFKEPFSTGHAVFFLPFNQILENMGTLQDVMQSIDIISGKYKHPSAGLAKYGFYIPASNHC